MTNTNVVGFVQDMHQLLSDNKVGHFACASLNELSAIHCEEKNVTSTLLFTACLMYDKWHNVTTMSCKKCHNAQQQQLEKNRSFMLFVGHRTYRCLYLQTFRETV